MSLSNNQTVAAVAAALVTVIGGAVVAYLSLPSGDTSPPNKPLIEDIVSAASGDDEITIVYSGAMDEQDGSGLRQVVLLMRAERDTEWREVGSNTAPAGNITMERPSEPGRYHFDLVATDQAGNATAQPDGTTGQKDWLVAPEAVPEIAAQPAPSDEADPEARPQAAQGNNVFVPQLPAQRPGQIVIPVAIHAISNADEPAITMDVVHAQIDVLNRSFHGGDISFFLHSFTETENPDWVEIRAHSPADRQMREALRVDTPSALNVFVTGSTQNLLSYSTFPASRALNPDFDGCFIERHVLPGGTAPFDEGKTLVHCVGHWLGLFHTFQDGCDGAGDMVDDTPAHRSPSFGRPAEGDGDACVEGEAVPVDNFMNYTDDAVRTTFTAGQFDRMRDQTAQFRPELFFSQP